MLPSLLFLISKKKNTSHNAYLSIRLRRRAPHGHFPDVFAAARLHAVAPRARNAPLAANGGLQRRWGERGGELPPTGGLEDGGGAVVVGRR